MSSIKDSGERTQFDTGAVRDMHSGKGRFDLLPWVGIHEVAKHCEQGAEKYGEHNVDKGIPQHSLIDSAFRHLAKHTMGLTDEDHLRAAAWNILWALQQRTTHPHLIDVPWRDQTAILPNLHTWIENVVINGIDKAACTGCIYDRVSESEFPCKDCKHNCPRSDDSYFDPNWKVIVSLMSVRKINTDNLGLPKGADAIPWSSDE